MFLLARQQVTGTCQGEQGYLKLTGQPLVPLRLSLPGKALTQSWSGGQVEDQVSAAADTCVSSVVLTFCGVSSKGLNFEQFATSMRWVALCIFY